MFSSWKNTENNSFNENQRFIVSEITFSSTWTFQLNFTVRDRFGSDWMRSSNSYRAATQKVRHSGRKICPRMETVYLWIYGCACWKCLSRNISARWLCPRIFRASLRPSCRRGNSADSGNRRAFLLLPLTWPVAGFCWRRSSCASRRRGRSSCPRSEPASASCETELSQHRRGNANDSLTWHDPRNVSESSSWSANEDLMVSLPLSLLTISISQCFRFSCDFLFVESCTRMIPLACW